jgi:hypothetical protein
MHLATAAKVCGVICCGGEGMEIGSISFQIVIPMAMKNRIARDRPMKTGCLQYYMFVSAFVSALM